MGIDRYEGEMKSKYDRILCDPPFLSPDCQTKGWSLTAQLRKAVALAD